MEFYNIKFIDSLLYFHMPISSLPKAYGLPEVSNEHFVICLTDPKIKATSDHFHQGRCSRQTRSKDREKFSIWYNQRIKEGGEFDF